MKKTRYELQNELMGDAVVAMFLDLQEQIYNDSKYSELDMDDMMSWITTTVGHFMSYSPYDELETIKLVKQGVRMGYREQKKHEEEK